MDQDVSRLLVEFVESVGLLRLDIQQRKELDKYEGRLARIDQKRSALVAHISQDDPDQTTTLKPELPKLLIEFVEKVGLLRRDMQQRKELNKYEGLIARIEQKLSPLAEQISREDPDLAKALRSAWQLPARSLAFRNADHQKDMKQSDND